MPRKPTNLAQVKFRISEGLRRQIEVEAKKNNRTQGQEMALRLQRSFIDQGVDALIKQTALTVAVEVTKNVSDLNANLHEHFNELAKAIGRPDLVINLKQGDGNNG